MWSASHVAAVRRGIPAILIELGEEGRCKQERLDLGLRAIRNVLIHAGMLAGSPKLPPSWTVVAGTYMVSPGTGCFYATASAGDRVQEGDVVGTIVDLWGNVIDNVMAPSDGMIVSTRTFPLLHTGARTTFVGRILDTLGPAQIALDGDAATSHRGVMMSDTNALGGNAREDPTCGPHQWGWRRSNYPIRRSTACWSEEGLWSHTSSSAICPQVVIRWDLRTF